MKYNIVFVALLAFIFVSCSNNQNSGANAHVRENDSHADCDHEHPADSASKTVDAHTEGKAHDCDDDHANAEDSGDAHNNPEGTAHDDEHKHTAAAEMQTDDGHKHDAPVETQADDGHNHEDVKILLTAYNENFEVFAEANPFVVGKVSHILAHFSSIPDFRAIEKGSITACLVVNGKKAIQKLNKPLRKGIYEFEINAQTAGKGVLFFDIETDAGESRVTVHDVEAFIDEHDAIHEADQATIHADNATVFTKEQSWKIDFATELPTIEPFGQLIKTTAQILPAQNDEVLVSAKTNGMVLLTADDVMEGKSVKTGQQILSISASDLADNNLSVRYMEARNNYEKTKSDYDRKKELADSKIVSERELLDAKHNYDNAKVIYDNLNENFSMSGQSVKSPVKGFINQLLVANGQYVEVGQPLFSVSQNNKLLLKADVQQKYAPILGNIVSANIRTLFNNKTYTIEELNGKVLSYGRTVNGDNFMIPVTLQVDNNGQLVPGSFVEVYLKTISNTQAVTIPNSALLEEQGHFFAFIQLTPELFEMREITPGATDGLKTKITHGISPSERVVSKGAIMIKLARSTGALDAHSGHVH